MSSSNRSAEIPQQMKVLSNWVAWKLEKINGKETKPPYIVGTNRHASPTDPSTWTTLEAAVAGVAVNVKQGIGFAIGDSGFVGIDMDGCRNPDTEEILPWADEILESLPPGTFVDITPSGTGVRAWVKGELPVGDRVFHLDPSVGYGDKVQIELLGKGRYGTVPGNPLYDEAGDVVSCDLSVVYKQLDDLRQKYPATGKTTTAPKKNVESGITEESLSVQVQNLSGPVSSGKYALFMRGTISGDKPFHIEDDRGNFMDYDDRSGSDYGFCYVAAVHHRNKQGEAKADAIWNDYKDSSIYREYWGKRETYFREHTIAKQVAAAEKSDAENNPTTSQESNVPSVTSEVPKPFVMVQGDSFMLEKIAPRKVLMRTKTRGEAVFYAKSINQVFAWRGNGKTCLGLGLTAAFATGQSFLNFESPEPVNVLYIEGELPEEQMQERWKQIIGTTGGRARLVTIDKQPEHTFPSFASAEGMARVEATLARCESEDFPVDVLFLDSVSTLFNIAANDEENWINIQTWLLRLRSQGLCIFFFHHAGKSGMSRSHSKSEDMLDVSIKLDTPDDKEEGVLHAILEFDKARHGISEPKAVIKMRPIHSPACPCNATKGKLVGCRGDSVLWEHEILTDLKKAQAFEMFVRGVSVRKAAKDLGVNKSKVGRWREEYGRGVTNAIDQSAVEEKD